MQRLIAAVAMTALTVLASAWFAPPIAGANGGAYIQLEGTHHLPGEQVTGEVYASVPSKHRDLLERGPFYAYLLPGRGVIEEGRPLPEGAIRVGTFVVADDRPGAGGQTELRVSFVVPDVEGDYYDIGLCNDPCTVSGFGESVTGTVSIVATAREGALLTDNGKLHAQVSGLRRDLRKTEKAAEDRAALAASDFEESEASRLSLAGRVHSLETELASARAAAEEAAGRPLIDPWAAAAVAVAIAVVTWLIARRGRAAGPEGAGAVPEHA